MPLATYKDLCIDATDARRTATFWAGVLGLDIHLHDDGDAHLSGPTPQHTVWVNTVPEPVTVKQRVHLDVLAASTEDVLALGAIPLDLETSSWDVLRDPEGGELCVFHRDELPPDRLLEVVVDADDHHAVASWWADVLGAELHRDEQDRWSWLEQVPGTPFDHLVFQQVPEPKALKNRIHWDVDAPNVGGLVDRGARVVREPAGGATWTVLADPEGNEFCAFTPA